MSTIFDAGRPPRRRLIGRVTGDAAFMPLVVLFGFNMVDEFDRSAFGLLLPEIGESFGLDLSGILAIEALAAFALIFLTVPLGHYADRLNRMAIATSGAAMWGVFSLLTGLAPSLALLGLVRVGAGLGRAVVEPTHNSLLADFYDINVRNKVYGFHRAANNVGRCIAPITAGVLAYYYGWRLPFLIFAIPTGIFVVLALRVREPKRGVFERTAAGAQGDTVETEEVPPSFAEGWRILWQVRTLRRIWISLIFLGVSLIGLASVISIFFAVEFGLNEAQRALVFAASEGSAVIAIMVGIPLTTRVALQNPGRLLVILGLLSGALAGAVALLSFSPNLAVAVGLTILITGGNALLTPGVYTALSLAIPPKVRSLGFSVGALFIIPAILFLPILGQIADEVGMRRGILFLVPIYAIGAVIIGTSGKFMSRDILRVWTAAATQAEVRAGRLKGDPKILVCRGVDVSYGQTQVLFNVDFEVRDGEIVALLGTNGAGKSTLLKAISGAVEPGAGTIIYDGRDITFSPANETVAMGVILVPGGKGVFPSLTVAENFQLAGWLYQKDPEHLESAVRQALDFFPVLRERWDQKAGNLSGGE